MDEHPPILGPAQSSEPSSIGPVAFEPGSPEERRGDEVDWSRLLGLGDVHLAADNGATALEYYERARSLLAAPSAGGGSLADQLQVEFRIAECLRRRGRHQEAAEVLADLLGSVDGRGDRVELARIRARLGRLELSLGRYVDAQRHCADAYEVLRETSANEEIGFLELTLGGIALRFGQVARAREHYESALFTFRRIDHREGIAQSLNNLGVLLTNGPRWSEAREYLERGLSVSEEAGNYFRIAAASLNLGILCTRRVEWTAAQQNLSRALHVFREIGNASGQTKAMLALGNLQLRQRKDRLAERHYRQALALAGEHGHQREEVLAHEFMGELLLRQGAYREAEVALESALTLALRIAPEGDLVSEVLRRKAEIALARGDAARVISDALEAAAIAHRVGDSVEAGVSLRVYAQAVIETGRFEHAQSILDQTVALLSDTPDVLEWLRARWARAQLLHLRSQIDAADPAARVWRREATVSLEEVAARLVELDLPEVALEVLRELAAVRALAGELDEAFATVASAFELAEQRSLTEWCSKLEVVRAELEERFAESSLARSSEYRVVQDLAGFGPDASLEEGVRQAIERSRSDRAFLAWGEVADAQPRLEVCLGFPSECGAGSLDRLAEQFLGEFRAGRKVFVSNSPRTDPRFAAAPEWIRDADAAVAIPLSLGADGSVGLLYLDRGPGSMVGPYRNPDLRLLSLFAGLLSVFLAAEVRARRAADASRTSAAPDPYDAFVTCSSELRRAIGLLRKLGDSDVGVLVTGETGTGKGLLARLIHQASRRHAGLFVPINCAALPETLLESELFGHVQGAFTGAVRTKPGLFEEAEGGSLFLDEVDRAPLGVQAKLLHVLDQHEIRPVGATRWHSVDVRVICATNADLRRAILEGRFLEDLYYRLNDFQVNIPPLRERREDVPLLIRRFYDQFVAELGRSQLGITREAMQLLTDHEWRGNVRELGKVVKRMVVLADDGERLGVDSLPREILDGSGRGADAPKGTLRSEIQRLESRMIGDALERARGNKSEAARQLHLSYPSLLSKIRQYGLEPRVRVPR